MALTLCRFPGPVQLQLAKETGGEPAQIGVGHSRYFMTPCDIVKSMTP